MTSNRPPAPRIPVHRSPTAAATTIHRNTLISDVLPNTADPISDEKPGNHFKNLTEMSVRFSPSTSMVYASSMFSQSGSLQALKQRREKLRDLRPSTDLRPLSNIIQLPTSARRYIFQCEKFGLAAPRRGAALLTLLPPPNLPPDSPLTATSPRWRRFPTRPSAPDANTYSAVKQSQYTPQKTSTTLPPPPVRQSRTTWCRTWGQTSSSHMMKFRYILLFPRLRTSTIAHGRNLRQRDRRDTLHLPIDPPGAASPKFKIQRKAVPLLVPPDSAVTSPVAFEDKKGNSNPVPVGLQQRQIAAVLAFVRSQTSAANARRRVLVLTPRGHLTREGLALMACYLACAERCGVKSVLRKFESSESEVSHPWRGLLGEEGVVGAYLEEMLNSR
ncbi:hypothetical protein C8J57DRAFT_1231315 [Mycena rebaudengoi]|nr:hypothetical protein C8J57DRAFT_1231315 [Mycena rebaudengoi]